VTNVTLTFAIPTAAVFKLSLKATGFAKIVLQRWKNKKKGEK
jgi:hypothetical protein